MNTEFEPPRMLPLRVLGWLSMPWRHWIYIGSTLLFGLVFVTLAPVPFITRLLVLVVPLLTAMALAFPYGGLHLDEWILLAVRYRLRPAKKMADLQDLRGDGQTEQDLAQLLETGLDALASAPSEKHLLPGTYPPDAAERTGIISGQAASRVAPSPNQIYLAGTYGLLRRSYGIAPESAMGGITPEAASGTAPTNPQSATSPLRRVPAEHPMSPPPEGPLPPLHQ